MPRPPAHFIISRNNYHRCVVLQIIYSYFIFSQFSHQHCSFVRYNINKIILISPIWPHSIRHLAFYGLDPSAETRVPKKTKIFKNEYAKNTLPEGKFFCPLVSALQFWPESRAPKLYFTTVRNNYYYKWESPSILCHYNIWIIAILNITYVNC